MTETKPRGRPLEHKPPPLIPDTPEYIAEAILASPPKKREDWQYLKANSR